ncbi:unnamed protein product [Moneuplotes crassus]|uniref:Uncharacterized protein n=1 Tax=Euplotes crassus TaxID=5936 RepID=A0AAD1Y410_EUPCR|nr:unnamed protein product [Moneuplotes crassus]
MLQSVKPRRPLCLPLLRLPFATMCTKNKDEFYSENIDTNREKFSIERLVKQAQKEEKRKVSEYHDVDQYIHEQQFDHREIEQDENSDEELDSIIETDQILKEFYENPTQASHNKIIRLFKCLVRIEEMVNFGDSPIMSHEDEQNSEIMEVMRDAVSSQIPFFSDIKQVESLAQIAFDIGLPSKAFWASISHIIATAHQELDIDTTISLLYLLYRHYQGSKILVNKDYIEGSDFNKLKVAHRYTYDYVMNYLQEEIDSVMAELETSAVFRILDLARILYLSKVCKLDLFIDELAQDKLVLYLDKCVSGAEILEEDIADENELVNEYIDNLNQFTKDFKLVQCFDLLDIIESSKDILQGKADLLKFVIYQITENMREPDFYKGSLLRNSNSSITYSRVSQLLSLVKSFGIEGEELEDALKVSEFLLMKAISISDREIKEQPELTGAIIKTEEELLAGNDETQIGTIKFQEETLEQLSLITLEYESLAKPKETLTSLLTFEADFIIKSYLKTALKEINDHSGDHVSENVNKIPSRIINKYIEFQVMLARLCDLSSMDLHQDKMTIIKQNYLRIINLVLHNESFQECVDERVYYVLKSVQGIGLLEERILDQVLELVKRRIYTYQQLANWENKIKKEILKCFWLNLLIQSYIDTLLKNFSLPTNFLKLLWDIAKSFSFLINIYLPYFSEKLVEIIIIFIKLQELCDMSHSYALFSLKEFYF